MNTINRKNMKNTINTTNTRRFIGLLFSLTTGIGLAGNACERSNNQPQLYLDASKKALEVQAQLNRLNPKVALIARVGSNLKPYGQYYSHIGFVVKNYPGQKGKWTVVHLLNQCDLPQSSIYKQGLMNFFMDDLYNLDYQITIPTEATQEKLYQTLRSPQIQSLHKRDYSMIAYPFSTKYQNSNQWVLELIATSINPQSAVNSQSTINSQSAKNINSQSSNSRSAAQAYLAKTHYQPSLIPINGISKFNASLFSSHVKFDDHPLEEQRRNKFATVTVTSVVDYLRKQGRVKSNTAYAYTE